MPAEQTHQKPDRKPLITLVIGILTFFTGIGFGFWQGVEAHHANERADKEASQRHDADVKAETAERIARDATAKATAAAQTITSTEQKASAAEQSASQEKQRADASEQARKDDAEKADALLKAEQAKAADADKKVKALQDQYTHDRASIAAFAEDYFDHLSKIKRALYRYIDRKNTKAAEDAAGDLKVQVRAFGDFISSWVQVHIAMDPLLDHYVEQMITLAMNNEVDRIAEVFRVIQEEAPDKIKSLREKAAQIK
jgi:hypothetical protein